jgi:antitoxin component YwqK of YwqJK toxin-antitoxin module
MKISSTLLFLLFGISAHGQFDVIDPNAGKTAEEPKALVCRDARFRMVSDCNGMVYNETVNVNGQDQEVIFHQKSGKPFTGECKVCHNNGNLYMYLKYQNGFSVGIDTVYWENGNINLIRSHDELGLGTEHGTWKFYREDGSLKWEKSYVNGAADGEQRHYFPDSTLEKIEVWKMDQLNGKKQEFYEGGQLKKEVNYKNGKWDGRYITYFEDGKVESEQNYVNDKKEGISTYYHRNGSIFYTESHVNGLKEGEFERFYPDEKKWTVENYKSDLRHGHFEEYYQNEKNVIKYTAEYKKGTLIEEHFFDEFGDETRPPDTPANPEGDKEGEGAPEGEGDGKKKKKDKKKKGEEG